MNPLYGMMNGRPQAPAETAQAQQVNANTPEGWNAAMGQLMANPEAMLKQAGFNLPGNMGGDPRKMAMHLIQSGQVGGPMMRMIAPMLARMGVK